MFSEIIKTEEALRAVIGVPSQLVLDKVIPTLDVYCRTFIAQSPFMLIGSSDAAGQLDVSPRGDPPGFAYVLDDQTLLLPERPGNRRADTLLNIMQNPHVGLLFLVPGVEDTLRVNGTAQIVRDASARAHFVVQGKTPDLVLAVTVREAYMQCAKCMRRSKLWAGVTAAPNMPSLAEIVAAHAKSDVPVEELQASIDQSYATKMY